MVSRRSFLRTGAALLTAGVWRSLPRPVRAGAPAIRLSWYPYELKLRHMFGVAGSSRTTTQGVQVTLEYEGTVGYGEASMPPYLGESAASVQEFLGRIDLAPFRDPFETEEILDYVDRIAENNAAAKASVDIALHDLVGKLIGRPWYRIWGYSAEKTPSTFYTIGIDTPEKVAEKTKEAPAFPILKVKLGRTPKEDREMVEAVRSATDRPFAVDANQGWTEKTAALDMIEWLADKGCVLVEQPMSKHRPDDIAWITARSPLPVMADESLQRLWDIPTLSGVFSGINIKLMKCTGLREAKKMIDAARTLGMKVMIGCMTETSCAISAAAQLSPAVDWADLDGNLLIANDIFDGVGVSPEGKLLLSDRPGIGVVPKSPDGEGRS
ncbi:MAG: dipeptide epimerase [Thermoguttaceae bacterium]|nr:dipeptide epimerase [Thermoguttaceae bacterium]